MVPSFAAPPIPTWTATAVEAVERAEEATSPLAVAIAEPRTRNMEPVLWEPVESPAHAWFDEATLTVELSPKPGRLYYLVSTARAEGVVAHWRQGPFEAGEATLVEAVVVPQEVHDFVEQAGHGRLTTRIVATDFADVTTERDVVLRTYLLSDGAGFMGADADTRQALDAALESTEEAP
jgi:hypothetical protein